jgi:hypothetical protein
MRRPLAGLILVLLAVAAGLLARGGDPGFSPEREAAVLAFVGDHHRDLARLLDSLKRMNRDEYEKAIVELDEVREMLAKIRESDPERSDLALKAWKARSRVELLAALVARSPTPKLEKQLRQAIKNQIDAELKQHRYERDRVAARLAVLDESIGRLEKARDRDIDERYEAIVKKARGVRKPGPTPDVPPPRDSKPGEGTR